jgi:hypothetical protein
MPFPQRPTDLFVTNGWYLDGLPGLVSPHFETLEGIQLVSNSVEIVDAGTNIKHRFSSQILDYGTMTITRTLQGTPDDAVIATLVENMIRLGIKFSVNAIKFHHQVEAFRLLMEGFRVSAVNYPTWDVNAEEKHIISYTATCDGWTII